MKSDKRIAENRGRCGRRLPRTDRDDGTRDCKSAANAGDVRRRGFGRLVHAAIIYGTDCPGGKGRRIMSLTPEISVELALAIRMCSVADVIAEFTRQVSKTLRVSAISSNLKGEGILDLKGAATYVAASWRELNLQRWYTAIAPRPPGSRKRG
jgi:hypothetical protein